MLTTRVMRAILVLTSFSGSKHLIDSNGKCLTYVPHSAPSNKTGAEAHQYGSIVFLSNYQVCEQLRARVLLMHSSHLRRRRKAAGLFLPELRFI